MVFAAWPYFSAGNRACFSNGSLRCHFHWLSWYRAVGRSRNTDCNRRSNQANHPHHTGAAPGYRCGSRDHPNDKCHCCWHNSTGFGLGKDWTRLMRCGSCSGESKAASRSNVPRSVQKLDFCWFQDGVLGSSVIGCPDASGSGSIFKGR